VFEYRGHAHFHLCDPFTNICGAGDPDGRAHQHSNRSGHCDTDAAPTAAPTSTPTAAATATPTAAPTPPPTSTPTAAPSPAPSETPIAVPSSNATPLIAPCTGTADHQAFFAQAANLEHFDVYCGALPTQWYLQATAYTLPNGGTLTIQYKKVGGGQLDIAEGAYCLTGAAACSPHVSVLGTASFGNLPGALDLFSSSPSVFVIYVAPGTGHAYSIKGTGMTQATFVSLATLMARVPKS
jgi:hypothetical protein